MPNSRNSFPVVVLFLLFPALAGLAAEAFAATPDWTTISEDFFPLESATSENPVITGPMVTDMGALHVADPFLMRRDDTWFMAFEAAGSPGKICIAQSSDALHWHYLHKIISESFHLSFPCFFEDGGSYYIVPESGTQNLVRLYKATSFPHTWAFEAVLITGRPFADPSVFQYHGTWWMFVSNAGSTDCWLYFSDFLDHGWQEHPMSPIVQGDRSRARPAGRTIVLANDRVYRLAQKCDNYYGEAVRAFAVDVLTRTNYSEHEIQESPILQPGQEAWNGHGMHTCDPWWDGDHWVAAVDGFDNTRWTIGIYRTENTGGPASSPELPFFGGPASRSSLRLSLEPSPFLRDLEIRWTGAAAGPAEILITDSAGRVLRRLSSPGLAGSGLLRWDGRDEAQRPVAAGPCFLTLRAGGAVTGAKAVRLR